ncbi:hypothetical protein V9L05_11695 [Bernardetia sp. Wsw4-3y2]|uniref:hypothetical protein n=1 Tax=unclassified Bernardetia TaxID=2647129 RepID=UPI0030CD003C
MNEFKTEDYNFSNDYFSINTDNFPYVYIKFEAKQPTEEEFEEYIKYAAKIFLQNQPYVIILNLSKTGYLKTKYRVQVANWFKEHQTHVSKFCKGTAHITDSAVHKFLLQGIFAIQKPPYEYIVVKEEEKAYEWLKEQLQQ